MNRYIQGKDTNQMNIIPTCFDDMISQDNPVRAISAIVEHTDIHSMGLNIPNNIEIPHSCRTLRNSILLK